MDQKEALKISMSVPQNTKIPRWIEKLIRKAARQGEFTASIGNRPLSENEMRLLHEMGYGISPVFNSCRRISWDKDYRASSEFVPPNAKSVGIRL